jgi:hypothetical protein
MKCNDIVRLGITRASANGSSVMAALPAVLQQFGLRTFIEQINTEADLRAFWSEPAVAAQATVIDGQGWDQTPEEAALNWPVLDVRTHQFSSFALRPQQMNSVVQRGSGILLSLVPYSGKRVWADGFFRAGFEHYVAPYAACNAASALQFATQFFGYLLWEQRDSQPQRLEVAEAADRARRVDEFADGAHGFRYFCCNVNR